MRGFSSRFLDNQPENCCMRGYKGHTQTDLFKLIESSSLWVRGGDCQTFREVLHNLLLLQMSRIMLPKMTAKGGGVIVNLSSLVHEAALPKCTTYCASKVSIGHASMPSLVPRLPESTH